MSGSGRGAWGFVVAGLLVVAAAGGYLAYRSARGTSGAYNYRPATPATTQSAPDTQPSSKPAKPKPPTTTFVDVVRAAYPSYATTRPLGSAVRELSEAAHVLLKGPVYVGPTYRRDLWITRSDGPPTDVVLRTAANPKESPQVHVLPDRVRFVHWTNERWPGRPFVVVDKPNGGGVEVVSLKGREPIAGNRAYDWNRAISWNDKVIVPSDTGVSIFRFEPKVTEDYRQLIDSTGEPRPHAPAQALRDGTGVIAWIPSENGQPGSKSAARYVNDQWTDLGPAQGWPEQIFQLIPLLDGSVLQMAAQPDGTVKLSLTSQEKAEIDEQAVIGLVEKMSDPDPDVREKAFKELSRYGPGAYGLLEQLAKTQPPEARTRLRALMKTQVQPTLGGMSLIGGKLQTVTRQSDGGVVFFSEGGVAIARESGEPLRRVPAWLALRPGRVAEVLDAYMVEELQPDRCEIVSVNDEWIVTDEAAGPRRWVGNAFVPLLRKDEREFTDVLGLDGRGRWLFRKPGDDSETLVIDPWLPDPTPRLPYWEIAQGTEFGWDAKGWPAVRRTEESVWALESDGWRLLNKKKGEILQTAPLTEPAAEVAVATTTLTSAPSKGSPLLHADGADYFDGIDGLDVTTADGKTIRWTFPPAALGEGKPTLLRTPDGTLFLFNQPGRLLRIRPTPDADEPFTVEATFTRGVPNTPPRRIWLDPAGRIVIAAEDRVTVLFPQGFIPSAIRDLMPLEHSEP